MELRKPQMKGNCQDEQEVRAIDGTIVEGGMSGTSDLEANSDDPEVVDVKSTKPAIAPHRLSRLQSTHTVSAFILILGVSVTSAFLGLGIYSAFQTQKDSFERSANDLVKKIERAWDDYVSVASVIHGRCRSRNFTRQEFRDLYEYLVASGFDFQAAQFDPNITHEERGAAEAEARAFYAENYPHVNYRGIIGFNHNNSTTLEPRLEADYYFPIHYMEPVVGNEAAIDLDYSASGSRRRTVMYCMENGKTALTDRLRLVQEKEAVSYGVVLMHPGFNLTSGRDVWPRDLASIVIRIPDLLQRSAADQGESSAVYVYDKSDSGGRPLFLGAAAIRSSKDNSAELEFLEEISLEEIRSARHYVEKDIPAANKIWTVSVVALDGTFEPAYTFIVIGGAIILVATVCLAFWVHQNTKRVARFNRLEAEGEAERAALIVEGAKKSAQAERELNDFVAHEVRNPVAAAMSACSFVKTSLNEKDPLRDEESIDNTKADVKIIDNALHFVNDLLRNMLDMHRAANKQLKVELAPTDVLHDVFEPVQAMLMQREGKVRVVVDCPNGTYAMADRLRLNQIVMNLGRNSIKFVDEGFIRLRAREVDDCVQVAVEDSGPGIPEEKKERLFQKYQESLDMLSQGTGIGLFLCKSLAELMDGDIHLDPNYDSGIPDFPGSRFVVNLKKPPADFDPETLTPLEDDASSRAVVPDNDHAELPRHLSVLFVDDDPILRKLFARSVKNAAPDWSIREASNGETALSLVENNQKFDLIFMDMYMASVRKQLLGTETVVGLRARGVNCRICGLSANDKEEEFLEAGADAFTLKPFPCEKGALRRELRRILFSNLANDGVAVPDV